MEQANGGGDGGGRGGGVGGGGSGQELSAVRDAELTPAVSMGTT